MKMRLTKTNKEWMRIALYLGEDNMILFSESRYEWINEYEVFWDLVEAHGLQVAKVMAEQKIDEAFGEIEDRLGLSE
tara:strand:- start:582 stop:812 length:231 start_codon:yes stop_codon:yes gene_type:complete